MSRKFAKLNDIMFGKLENAFDFDETDILLNQKGQLSEKQNKLISEYERINRFGGRLSLVVMVITTTLFGAIAFYAMGIAHLRTHPGAAYSYMAAFSIMWLLYLVSILWGKMRSDVKSRRISSVEGTTERKTKKVRQWTAYYVTVDGVKFQIATKAQYNAFKPNVYYRIFYIKYPPTHIILSVSEQINTLI